MMDSVESITERADTDGYFYDIEDDKSAPSTPTGN